MAFGAILGQTFDGYTKEQTISDQTKLMLGLPTTATPDEAFVALYFNNQSASLFAVTVLQPNGQPWPNLQLNGVTNMNGGSIATNENGYALCRADSATPTVTATSNLLDVDNISQQLNKDENFITNVTITSNYISSYITITDSRRITTADFTSSVTTINFTAVGGGGGGGSGSYSSYVNSITGGGGGGGGYVATVLNRAVSSIGTYIDITIGAGGAGGTYQNSERTDATNGGQTRVVGANSSYLNLVANGGNAGEGRGEYRQVEGGTGNGNGGQGAGGSDTNHQRSAEDGVAGTGYIFNSMSLGLAGGGGGGGGCNRYENTQSAGGAPYGAAGGRRSGSGLDGTKGGGGGGGGDGYDQYNGLPGGRGGDGIVYMSFNH